MRFRFLLLTTSLILLTSPLDAQWSTSTRAESTLYVCPGFYPGIVTFDDGSSIVLGALQSYIFARKLDERGYYMWTPPVQVFHNDSSFITDVETKWGGYVSDSDGGVIVFWYDHRGAYRDQQTGRWLNNAIYAQRVDKFGIVRWASGGVLVKGPETGIKDAGIVGDGIGGCVIAWVDRGFDFPNAPNKSWLRAARFSSDGQKVWSGAMDSSTSSSSFFFADLVRAGIYLYFGHYRFGAVSYAILTVNGIQNPTPVWIERSGNISWRDSVLFRLAVSTNLLMHKIGPSGDTLWSTSFSLPTGCQGVLPFSNTGAVADEEGGVYYLYVCQDTIFHFDAAGQYVRVLFPKIGSIGGYVFSDGQHGLVLAGVSGRGQRYHSNGDAQWDTTYRYLTNAGNAEFRVYARDNNGGIIAAFWPLLNGIYVQHTGRNGRVGVLTKVEESTFDPLKIELSQNYPNPFNPVTNIEFRIDRLQEVALRVYDVLGQEVKKLVHATLHPGTYKIAFDGSSLASGAYIYRLLTPTRAETKRMMLLK